MLVHKPPMGWNTWNTFGDEIHEKLIMETADALVELGYREAGYEYLVIDDCWALKERGKDGRLVPDPEKFPHGMEYLANYVHSKGLKFGIYTCAGVRTCAGYPGSYDHEYVDAQTFADWGVDYLKYDFCNFPEIADCKNRYLRMSMALKATGREILFAACNWGVEEPGRWMASIGAHMYRSNWDISDNYKSFRDIAVSQMEKLCMSRPGCFNDMDILTVGMYGRGNVGLGGCTDEEYRTEFALWCLFGVPLMIGGDVRTLNEFSRKLLQNKALLALNQDRECRPPYLAETNQSVNYGERDRYFLIRHLSDNEFVLAYFNFSDSDAPVSYTFGTAFDEIGIPYGCGYGLELTDLYTGENLGVRQDYFSPAIPIHGSRLFRAKLVKL